MSSGLFENVIYKMCLEIKYLIYIYIYIYMKVAGKNIIQIGEYIMM